MKKIFFLIISLFIINSARAYDYQIPVLNSLNDGETINYNYKTGWNAKEKPDIIFTKYMTVGSGGFSVLSVNDKQYDTNTTYEFTDKNKLIGYNSHLLKFYKLDFDGKKIINTELSANEVQKYFPDVEIVKISDFKNNKITLTKKPFKKKAYMLLNDTDGDFYKYQFEHVKKYQIIKGIFEAIIPKTIIYSHFASREKMFPILEIKIKNGK